MRRASTPNQGYSGRGSRGGYAGPRGSEVADIWEVVSELASALQDARNQLVNLMHGACKDDQMRLAGGRSRSERSVSPSRDYSPRNVHRAHARGHVAFGLNSEYPVRLDRTRTPGRIRPREVYAQMRRCTHPLHGVGAETRRLTPRRVQPRWPSGQVRGCSKPHNHGDDLMSRRDTRAGANFTSASSRTSSPDQRRHRPCLATQFASLLAHEAHQQRERRLAEEARADKRPSWCRY